MLPVETQFRLLAMLLIKISIITGIASILMRSARFKEIVFAAKHTVTEQILLGLYIGMPVGIGVMMRAQFGYAIPDLGVEAALLAGVLGGGVSGVTVAILAALPTYFAHDGAEVLTLPVLVLVGLAGKAAAALAPDIEHIWHFSPFVDMNFYRWVRRRFGKPRGEWQLMF